MKHIQFVQCVAQCIPQGINTLFRGFSNPERPFSSVKMQAIFTWLTDVIRSTPSASKHVAKRKNGEGGEDVRTALADASCRNTSYSGAVVLAFNFWHGQ
jgi:hypothetical protein